MTREEQIVEYANSFKGKGVESDELKEIIRLAIIDGAKWADAHPQEPSLPSNIDEAANRQAALEQPYKWEEEQDGSFGVTPLFVMSNIRSAFKAGSEWMAEQGETQIVETRAVFDSHGVDYGGRYLYVDLPDDTPIGTEFIVQIRNKNE